MTIPDAQRWLKDYVRAVFARIYRDLGRHPIKREMFETEEEILLAAIDEGAGRLTRFLFGDSTMAEIQLDAARCDHFATELDALAQSERPKMGGAPDPKGSALWDHVQQLAAAFRSKDPNQILRAFRDVINHVLGEEVRPMVGTEAAGGVGAINWKRLGEILAQVAQFVLPLILK